MSNIDRSVKFFVRTRQWQKRSDQPETLFQQGYPMTLTRTRVGFSNPKWREQILNLENATTALQGIYDTYVGKPISGVWKYYHPSTGLTKDFTLSGDFPDANGTSMPQVYGPTMSQETALNGASAKFYSMLRSEVQKVSGPTFLGELAETLRMLRNPAAALKSDAHGYLDQLKKFQRGWKPRKSGNDMEQKAQWAKDLTKAASGLWLEQSFGWAPAINDCKGAMQALARLNKPRVGRIFSTSFKDLRDQSSTLVSPWNSGIPVNCVGIPAQFRYYGKKMDSVAVRYRGRLKAQTDMTPFDNWNLFGFQPSEFLPTAWELLPWSFLADYFSNIGDCLTAWSTVTDKVEVAYINRTIVQKTVFHGACVEDVAGTDSRNSGWKRTLGIVTGGSSDTTRKVVQRGIGQGNPPLPTFQLNTNLGAGQLANIAALLGQANALHGQRAPRNWHR